MAIVKYGTNIAGIRKTIGGITFGKAGSTPSCRVWRPSTMRYSDAQTNVQSRITNLVPSWQALTPAQRADWNYLGAHPAETDVNSLGQTYLLSGWQWFIRCNSRLLNSGLPLQLTAPSGAVTSPADLTIQIQWVGGGIQAAWYYTFAQWSANHKGILFGSCNRLHGNTVPSTDFYYILTMTPQAGGGLNFRNQFIAKFQSPPIGDKTFFRAFQQAPSGIRSPVRTTSCIIF